MSFSCVLKPLLILVLAVFLAPTSFASLENYQVISDLGKVYVLSPEENSYSFYRLNPGESKWQKIYSNTKGISFPELDFTGRFFSFVQLGQTSQANVLDLSGDSTKVIYEANTIKNPSSGLRISRDCQHASISLYEGDSIYEIYRLNLQESSWAKLTSLKGESFSSDMFTTQIYAFDHSSVPFSQKMNIHLKEHAKEKVISKDYYDSRRPRFSPSGDKLSYLARKSDLGIYHLVIYDRYTKKNKLYVLRDSPSQYQWLDESVLLLSSDLAPHELTLIDIKTFRRKKFNLNESFEGNIKTVLVAPKNSPKQCM